MPSDGLLEVGRIGRAHGVRGDVFVHLTTDRVERVAAGSRLKAGDRWLTVTARHRRNDRWRVHFEGVDDRSAAEALARIVLAGRADRRPRHAVGPPADRRRGGRGRRHSPRPLRRGGRQPGRRPARARVRGARAGRVRGLVRPTESSRSIRPRVCSSSASDAVCGSTSSRCSRSSVDTFCSESLLGKARASGAARPAPARSSRSHLRRAPHGRRRSVRRWAGDADAARAGVRRGRGRGSAAPAAAARAGRAPLRPGVGARAGRRRRVQPAVRALRGRRPPDPRASRRRRAERRRRRAQRRRGRGLPGDRGGDAAAAGRDGQRREPADGELRRHAGCSRSRTTPVRRRSGDGTCPTCCAAATTAASSAGGGRSRCTARWPRGPT